MSPMTPFVSSPRVARIALLASLALAIVPGGAHAQATAFKACTQGPVANCALIDLISGTSPYGANYFEIFVQNLGLATDPPTSITFLSFTAGGQDLGTGVDTNVQPFSFGGASITNTSEQWNVAAGSDAIFLSALDNQGVGGCAVGAGQAGTTCPDNSFFGFKFYTPTAYDPLQLTLADMEFDEPNSSSAEFCSDPPGCTITREPVTATPEPGTICLALTGFAALAGLRVRRRRVMPQTTDSSNDL